MAKPEKVSVTKKDIATVSADEMASEFKATRKRAIAVPVYSFKKRTQGFFRADEPIKMKEHVEKDDKGGEDKVKYTPVLRITDLETGEVCDMIVPTLLVSELNENFPNNSYVGLKFEVIVSAAAKEGKRYKTVQLWEIE